MSESPLRILVSGSRGKMGRVVLETFQSDARLSIVGTCDREESLSERIKACNPEVVIDFTAPEVVESHTQIILECGVRPVIGTTGLSHDAFERLKQEAQERGLGGIVAPNFSLGAVLAIRYAVDASRYFEDVEILERHHPKKKDAPSGTAILAAQALARSGFKRPGRPTPHQSFEGSLGARIEGIPVHAMRLPGVLADLDISFGALGETFTLSHRTVTRECFMPGLKLACLRVQELKTLVLGLETLL